MTDPLPPSTVSVVIPVLDDAEHLRTCLTALLAQTRPPDEIVVVDNGSIDDSADVARQFGARVVRESRRGIPAASSAGFDAATGSILARLDADCVPGERWLERVEEAMLREPQPAAVTGPAAFHDGPAPLRYVGAFAYLGAYFALVGLALGRPPLFGSNCAIRADAWASISGDVHRHDSHLHDDMDVSLHLDPLWPVRFVPTVDMRISARPFRSMSSLATRFDRGMHTLRSHWPDELPWRRILRRFHASPPHRNPRF